MNLYDLLDEQERLERVYREQRNRVTEEETHAIIDQLSGIAADINEIMAAERKAVLA